MKNTKSALANAMILKSTYTLDMLCDTVCNDDIEILAVYSALWEALQKYQWKYQKASVGTPVEEIDSIKNNFKKVIVLVKNQGHKSVASELEEILNNIVKNNISTKSSIVSKVGRMMENTMTSSIYKIKVSRYKKKFAKKMKEAFIEHCEKFRLETSQSHIDMNFKVPKKLKLNRKKM